MLRARARDPGAVPAWRRTGRARSHRLPTGRATASALASARRRRDRRPGPPPVARSSWLPLAIGGSERLERPMQRHTYRALAHAQPLADIARAAALDGNGLDDDALPFGEACQHLLGVRRR